MTEKKIYRYMLRKQLQVSPEKLAFWAKRHKTSPFVWKTVESLTPEEKARYTNEKIKRLHKSGVFVWQPQYFFYKGGRKLFAFGNHLSQFVV